MNRAGPTAAQAGTRWGESPVFTLFARNTPAPIALLVLILFLGVFLSYLLPQAPLRIRYLGVLAFIGLPVIISATRDVFSRVFLGYTIYVVAIGVYFTAIKGDGDVADAFSPLKTLLIVIFIISCGKYLRPLAFVQFACAWVFLQVLALLVELKTGPIWQQLPFPIFSDEHIELIAVRDISQERSGGLTFESSVLGVMMSLMTMLLLTNVVGFGTSGTSSLRRFLALLSGVTALLGFVAVFFIKTKSGLVVLVASAAFAVITTLLGRQRVGVKIGVLIGMAVLLVSGVFAFRLALQSSYGAYLEVERDRLMRVLEFGYSKDAETGFDTRLSYAKIGVLGLRHHPLGVGYSSGVSYAEPVLDSVVVTREMNQMFAIGSYRGYKGSIYNSLMHGGVVAISVLAWLILLTRRAAFNCQQRVWRLGADLFCFGILVAGLIAELWPLWETLALHYAWLGAVSREDAPQSRPPLPNR